MGRNDAEEFAKVTVVSRFPCGARCGSLRFCGYKPMSRFATPFVHHFDNRQEKDEVD
jgi:hypothetical protein